MTADEIAYAGGKSGTSLASPYAWYYLNSAGKSITGSTDWWSLSPNYWDGSTSLVWSVISGSSPGNLNFNYGSRVSLSYGARPAISLKSCIKYSTGDGTPETPYEIVETDTGC